MGGGCAAARKARGDKRSDEWKIASYVGRRFIALTVASLQPALLQSHMGSNLGWDLKSSIAVGAISMAIAEVAGGREERRGKRAAPAPQPTSRMAGDVRVLRWLMAREND